MFQSPLAQKPGLFILSRQRTVSTLQGLFALTLKSLWNGINVNTICARRLRGATSEERGQSKPTEDLIIVSGVESFYIFVKPFINIVPHQTSCQKTCDQHPPYKPLFHIYSWIIPANFITWPIIKRPPFEEIVSLTASVWRKIVNGNVFPSCIALVLNRSEDYFPSRDNDLPPMVYDFKNCLLIAYVNDG